MILFPVFAQAGDFFFFFFKLRRPLYIKVFVVLKCPLLLEATLLGYLGCRLIRSKVRGQYPAATVQVDHLFISPQTEETFRIAICKTLKHKTHKKPNSAFLSKAFLMAYDCQRGLNTRVSSIQPAKK